MPRLIRLWLLILGLALLFGGAITTHAQTYPTKPVRMVVSFAPGGSTDVTARMIAQKLSERWTHPMVVENRGGGGTIIATELVARAEPDGHTLLFTSAAFVINPGLRRSLPYDSLRDLAPVMMAVNSPNLLVVHPSVPANSISELIELAKAKPGTLSFGSSGIGTSNHLSGELLKFKTGIDMIHVPFKGTGDAMNSLLGGQISMMFDSMLSGLTQVRTGKLKALGVTSPKREPSAPGVPAIAETIPGYRVDAWLGIFAPGKISKELLKKVNEEIAWALMQPDVKAKLADLGTEVVADTPEQFLETVKREMAMWADVIKAAGIQPE